MDKERKRYILFIKNHLEDKSEYFFISDKKTTFINLSLEQMEGWEMDPAQAHGHVDINIIIVMHQKLLKKKNEEKIKRFINDKIPFTAEFCNLIYLKKKNRQDLQEIEISELDTTRHAYLMPDADTPLKTYNLNFQLYVKLIFTKLANEQRINSYIVDTFQNLITSHQITEEKKQLQKSHVQLKSVYKKDDLTQVLNRRGFFEELEALKKQVIRENWRLNHQKMPIIPPKRAECSFQNKPKGDFLDHYGKFCCILMDIDHFKKVNDIYGHLIGDKVLKELGAYLNHSQLFRNNDIIGRYGGEEFIIILLETNYQYAKIPIERLRKGIKKIKFYNDKGKKFHISASFGISEYKISDKTLQAVIHRADQALYHAKNNGRDQVIVYEEVFHEKSK